MAEKSWQTLKVQFCDHVGQEVNLQVEAVYPPEHLPDQSPRLVGHRCTAHRSRHHPVREEGIPPVAQLDDATVAIFIVRSRSRLRLSAPLGPARTLGRLGRGPCNGDHA